MNNKTNSETKHPLTKEVNKLTFALGEIDGFTMSYENITCSDYDEATDRSTLYLDGVAFATFVSGGPWNYVLEAKEKELLEALEIVKKSPNCPVLDD